MMEFEHLGSIYEVDIDYRKKQPRSWDKERGTKCKKLHQAKSTSYTKRLNY